MSGGRWRRKRRGRAGLALAGVAALLAACGGDAPSRLPAGTPVILVSIDTLRSDRLPAYGYAAGSTPALDRLRADSILFEHAFSPVPLTFPAHTTMMSGLLPPDHGVRDNTGYRFDGERLPHLPRLLHEAGYATGAAVSSFVLRGGGGLATGFDFYEDRIDFGDLAGGLGSVQRSGYRTLELAIDWLRGVADRPVFLFFHIYEPHSPYEPPPRFAAAHRSAYDGEIAAADDIVGRLLDELRTLGLYDRALLILVSDHGEALGDHGYQEHGPFLYREALQVPMLLKLPRAARAGESVATPTHLFDLLPTVLDLLGLPRPDGLPGTSLLTLADAPPASRALYAETFYPRVHFGWSELSSLIEFPYHYIHGPDPELYDLAADPAETVNLIRRERRVAVELRRELDGYDRAYAPPGEVDAATRQRLAALGYVGSVAGDAEGPLPDPKSRVHVLEDVRQAVLAFWDGRNEEAVAGFRRVLAEEPGLIDAWERLGSALLKLGRPAEAWEAYHQAVERSGGSAHVALPAANALLQMGRLDEAREHAELAAGTIDAAQDILAQIAIRQGRFEDAERHLERALSTRGTRVGPLITEAELRLRQERFQQAVDLTIAAERQAGDGDQRDALRSLYFLRGSALAQLGRLEEAERAFQREIEQSPDMLDAYTHLAFLFALGGDGPSAGGALKRMVDANPTPEAYAAAVRTLREMGDPRSAGALLRQALGRWPKSPELRALATP